jgi:hypothetical protein
VNNAQRMSLIITLLAIAATFLFPWAEWTTVDDGTTRAEITLNKEKPLGIELKVTKPTDRLSPYPFWIAERIDWTKTLIQAAIIGSVGVAITIGAGFRAKST